MKKKSLYGSRKGLLGLVGMGFLAMISFLLSPQLFTADLTDIEGDPRKSSIKTLFDQGVITGNPDNTFLGATSLNRAEWLALLLRSYLGEENIPERSGGCFIDMPAQEIRWYNKYVCLAKDMNVIKGYPDGTFRPGNPVSYVELLAMGLRLYGHVIEDSPSGDWFDAYLTFANEHEVLTTKVLNGRLSSHTYTPSAPVNRSDSAFIIHQLMLDKEGTLPLGTGGIAVVRQSKIPDQSGTVVTSGITSPRNDLPKLPDQSVGEMPEENNPSSNTSSAQVTASRSSGGGGGSRGGGGGGALQSQTPSGNQSTVEENEEEEEEEEESVTTGGEPTSGSDDPDPEEEVVEPDPFGGESSLDLNAIFDSQSYVEINLAACQSTCDWSNANAWLGGVLPEENDNVWIAPEAEMIYDLASSPDLNGMVIEGALSFLDDGDKQLTTNWTLVTGRFEIGSEAAPFPHLATLTFNDTNSGHSVMGMGTRGLLVMGGDLAFHGQHTSMPFMVLGDHIEAGDTSIVLDQAVDWHVGDDIVVSPTDFYDVYPQPAGGTERFTITHIAGNVIEVDQPFQYPHWGVLQYVCDTPAGVCLNEAQAYDHPTGDVSNVIDERAHVGNLTRGIVIQAPDDALWQNDGFGVHVMIMGTDNEANMEGVEIRRSGQEGLLGRYPLHYHGRSFDYTADPPVPSSDMTDYFRDSVIRESMNRGIVIHGTSGSTVENNIIHDVRGHAIFMEDGVERRNTIRYNFIVHGRDPEAGSVLKNHERNPGAGGASGIWMSNPDNTFSHNVVADMSGFGQWLAFAPYPSQGGIHQNVEIVPRHLPLLSVEYNTLYGNFGRAHMLDLPEVDAAGNTFAMMYNARIDPGQPLSQENWAETFIRGIRAFKNSSPNADMGCFWDRAGRLRLVNIVCSSHIDQYFSGSGDEGLIDETLVVGTTLNNQNVGLDYFQDRFTAFTTYHSTFDLTNNLVVNFPIPTPYDSEFTYGTYGTDDYYIRGVDRGLIRSQNNHRINAEFLTRSDPQLASYNLAGAIQDWYGEGGPAGNYIVYDDPFLTHNATCSPLAVDGTGLSCDGSYVGIDEFMLPLPGNPSERNNPDQDWMMELLVERIDDGDASGSVVGAWHTLAAPSFETLFSHMRSFAGRLGGIYRIDFPNVSDGSQGNPDILLSDIQFRVENLHEETDALTLVIPYHGSSDVALCLYTWFGSGSPCLWSDWIQTPEGSAFADNVAFPVLVGSPQEVVDATEMAYFHDEAANEIWVKLRGEDLAPVSSDTTPYLDPALYDQKRFRVIDVSLL